MNNITQFNNPHSLSQYLLINPMTLLDMAIGNAIKILKKGYTNLDVVAQIELQQENGLN